MGIFTFKELFRRNSASSDAKQLQEAEEDLLKAIYHAGELKHTEQLQALAHERGIGLGCLESIVGSLVLHGELLTHPYRLSESGTQRALRLIRAHRIYEKYLAEHSGHKPEDWHRLANKMEHHISPEEQARMASLLRNPLFDPHGDPIPTPSLDLPEYKTQSVVQVEAGVWFRVHHIEDDDMDIFALINSLNLARNSIIYIDLLTEDWCYLRYEGEQLRLSHEACAALTLERLELNEEETEALLLIKRLTHLREDEEATIWGLSPSCRGPMRRRLMDLGFVKGSRISIEMKSPMRNPIAYVVRGTAIALRRDQAQYILINPNP